MTPDRAEDRSAVSRRTALFTVIASAACFATLGVFTHYVYAAGVGPLPLLTWRFAAAALLMAAFQLVRAPREMAISIGDLGRFSLLALTGYGAASLCYFFALPLIGVSITTVLLYTYPAVVSLIGWVFLGEPFSARRLFAIALTFGGCVLVSGALETDARISVPGIALGLGAGLGYALFNVLSHRFMARKPRIVLMSYTFGISSIAIGVVALLVGSTLSTAAWTPTVWVLLAAIVIVPTFVAVVLYLEGLRRLGPSQAAIVSTIEPLFAIALSGLIIGERLGVAQWVGAAVVLGGVVLAERVAAPGDVDGAAAV
jgi:drug/metabolite transporter (DMT)-like permease